MTLTSFATATAPGGEARANAAEATDHWLGELWLTATNGRRRPGVALAAVGSHARAEAGPRSDLDLVLVHDGRLDAGEVSALADRLWYPMWDAGLSLDHSVRTLAECRAVAKTDLSATVGLLDLRLVAGDTDLVAAARAAVAHDWRAEARRRLPELLEAVAARHTRHGDVAHLIEPDLKEARGGLRDMSVVRALTAAWLTDRPHGAVDAAYRHLLDVRDAVHLVTGRSRDRVQRQDQAEIGQLLGYDDPRVLMREVADSARVLAHALDGTLRRASQSQKARALRVGPRRPAMTAIGYGMFAHDGEAVLGSSVDPSHDPLATLRAARVAAVAGLPLAPTTLGNLVAKTPALPTPWPVEARTLLTELLATGESVVPVWESLTLSGVVERWIPQWSGIRSVPQVSPVHRHTVDRHQIQCVVEAAPFLAEVRRPDLLLVAALLHDLGKIPDTPDHSLAGAPLAAAAATRMGFGPADVAVVELLVRHHLSLVELATKRDPEHPATISALLEIVDSDPDLLDLLTALTAADARAAGPRAWTEHRARLVELLVGGARRFLWKQRTPSPLPTPSDLPAEVRAAVHAGGPSVTVHNDGPTSRVVVAALDRVGFFADVAGLLAVEGLNVLSADLKTVDGIVYDTWVVDSPRSMRPDAEMLIRHLRRLEGGDRSMLRSLPLERALGAKAVVLPTPVDSALTVLELRMRDRVGLLRDVGLVLARVGVSVHDAQISTYAGRCIDTFVLSQSDGAALSPGRLEVVIDAVTRAA